MERLEDNRGSGRFCPIPTILPPEEEPGWLLARVPPPVQARVRADGWPGPSKAEGLPARLGPRPTRTWS